MLHAGLDLSRKKVDVCLLSDRGEHLDQLAVPPDADSLRTLARRIDETHSEPVCAVIESMTGARIVHDTLEQEGWAVEIADAQKVTRRLEGLLEGWRGTTADHLRGFLGPLNAMAGRFEDARGWVEEGRALTRDLGLRWYEGVQDLLSAHVERLAGDPAAATRDLRAAGEIFDEIGDGWFLSAVAVQLPAAVYAEGRYDEAAILAEAIEDTPAPTDLEWQVRRRAIGAKLLARKGDLDRAESLGREAVALVSASDFLGFHGDVLLDLAEVLELADRSAEAATAAEEAVRLHERKGNVVSAGRARTRAAELRGAGR